MHTYYFEFASSDRGYLQSGETEAATIEEAVIFVCRWLREDWDDMTLISIKEVA